MESVERCMKAILRMVKGVGWGNKHIVIGHPRTRHFISILASGLIINEMV
jgi:hypothetical protein